MPIEMKGTVSESKLAEIFRILKDEDIACSFLVSDGMSEKIFYFAIGGIRMVSLGGRKAPRISEILERQGRLDQSQRKKILQHSEESGKRFGESAVALGLVRREDVESAVRSQVEGELCDLYLWPEAEFEFNEGQPPSQFYESGYRARSISADVPDFIEGVEERRRQWSNNMSKVGSDRDVFELTDDGVEIRKIGAEDVVSQVLGLVDGSRRVRDLVGESGLSALTVYESLFSLLDNNFITRISGTETRSLSREEVLQEIKKLESARSRMMGDLIIRTRLAKAYEQIDERGKAAGIWVELGRMHRRKNDLKRSLEAFRKAARCNPDDFKTQETILDLYRAMGEQGKLLEEGRHLAEKLFKNNLLNRARNLLGNLVHLAPNDTRIRKLFALTLLGLGDEQLALMQMRDLAGILERAGGRSAELKEIYRRILALDKGDRSVRQKLLVASGQRRTIWISRSVIAAAALLLLVAGGSFVYELSARNAYAGEGLDIEALLLNNEFAVARRTVKDLQEDWGHSSVAKRMANRLERIDELEADYLKYGLLEDMKLARQLLEDGEYARATPILTRISNLDTSRGGRVAEVAADAARLLTEQVEASRRLTRARDHAAKGDYEKALGLYLNIADKFSYSKAAREIEWPVRILTVPSDAAVYVDGKDIPGDGPKLVAYSPAAKTQIRIERAGFEPRVLDVSEPFKNLDLVVSLQKQTRWVFEAEGPFESSPVLHENTLYIAGRDRYLYAIDTEDGSLKYRVALGIFGDSEAAVAVLDGVVVVGTSGGDVIGIDDRYGMIKWRKSLGHPVFADLTGDWERSVAYAAESGGRVIALNAKGDELWSISADQAADSSPWLQGDTLFVGRYKTLTALRAGDGGEDWSLDLGVRLSSSPTVGGSRVIVGGTDGKLYVVDATTRRNIATLSASGLLQARPVVAENHAFVGSLDGNFYCFALGGKPAELWKKHLGSEILAPAAVGAAGVYVGSTDGNLYCLDRRKGIARWAFRTGDKIVAAPVQHDGTIYVASMDGKIYAIPEFE